VPRLPIFVTRSELAVAVVSALALGIGATTAISR